MTSTITREEFDARLAQSTEQIRQKRLALEAQAAELEELIGRYSSALERLEAEQTGKQDTDTASRGREGLRSLLTELAERTSAVAGLPVIRAQTKRIVRSVYAFRCGYCGVSETQVGFELTFDHFRPQSQAGTDEAANLVYACHACNQFKGDYWTEDESARLLHPLIDNLTQHFVEEASGTLRPLTILGQIYIDRLQLNRSALIQNRWERQMFSRIENQMAEMINILREIASKMKDEKGK